MVFDFIRDSDAILTSLCIFAVLGFIFFCIIIYVSFFHDGYNCRELATELIRNNTESIKALVFLKGVGCD